MRVIYYLMMLGLVSMMDIRESIKSREEEKKYENGSFSFN